MPDSPKPAPPKPDPDARLVIAWSTRDPGALMVAKSLMDQSGIPYRIENEDLIHMGAQGPTTLGWGPRIGEFGVQVREEDAQTVVELLARIEAP